jgi:hypothetical protein
MHPHKTLHGPPLNNHSKGLKTTCWCETFGPHYSTFLQGGRSEEWGIPSPTVARLMFKGDAPQRRQLPVVASTAQRMGMGLKYGGSDEPSRPCGRLWWMHRLGEHVIVGSLCWFYFSWALASRVIIYTGGIGGYIFAEVDLVTSCLLVGTWAGLRIGSLWSN